jgi:hypothetical protein
MIPVITPAELVKPVARFTRPDLAPRGAVRRVGPRPNPTRSAEWDEPGGSGPPAWGWRPEALVAQPVGRISLKAATGRRTTA